MCAAASPQALAWVATDGPCSPHLPTHHHPPTITHPPTATASHNTHPPTHPPTPPTPAPPLVQGSGRSTACRTSTWARCRQTSRRFCVRHGESCRAGASTGRILHSRDLLLHYTLLAAHRREHWAPASFGSPVHLWGVKNRAYTEIHVPVLVNLRYEVSKGVGGE